MHNSFPPGRRGRVTARRLVPFAAATLAAAALAPAGAQAAASPIAVDAAQDSVIVTGLPLGMTTLQVTRPDLSTGKPAVIGQFRGLAFLGRPFSVNTTAPTALNPAGDCWQKGNLTQGLTPDILPGDTVSVVGGPSLKVPADAVADDGAPGGPIAGCASLSSWGRNVVTDASTQANGDLQVKGNAQPLATAVSVSGSDGATATKPVDAALAADGSFTATIPAAQVALLADGAMNVSGAYAVPDVAAGTVAHIGGTPFSMQKKTPARPAPAAPAPAAPAAPAAPDAPPAAQDAAIKLGGLKTTTRISLSSARKGHIQASFVVPTGASFVRVRLARPGHTAMLLIAKAGTPGTRQTVQLNGPGARKLVSGRYAITVGAGATKTQLGNPVLRGSVLVH
jgi:hypothetical protein